MKAIKIWDPFVRVFHWSLVTAIVAQLITAEDFKRLHARVGYFIIVLLVSRVIWGFIGSKHARFADFIYPPADILAYLKGLLKGATKQFPGHNPAGGAMVIALLVVLSLTTMTGLLTYGAERKGLLALGNGKLSARALADDGQQAANNRDDDHRQDGGSKRPREYASSGEMAHFWKEVHESLVGLLLSLAALHVCGVAASSYVHRENLIGAMITGKKKMD